MNAKAIRALLEAWRALELDDLTPEMWEQLARIRSHLEQAKRKPLKKGRPFGKKEG